MVLKIYGHDKSACTLRVVGIAKELEVPYEFVFVDLFKQEQKAPSFVEKNPFAMVPCIDDDGFVLYESRAICRYLATTYAKADAPLIPRDAIPNALFEEAASVEQNSFEPLAAVIAFEKVVSPVLGGQTNETVLADQIAKLDANLEVYDRILSKRKYLAGETITLADLFHLPYATMISSAGIDLFDRRPNVSRWHKDISSRQAWLDAWANPMKA
ncbi:glutathione S-transferase [Heterobasidion irregulare TC 32-1]|uniref:glutathione transferase n=4 Tax=Heterobasidion annosum species complex TaxID=256003 RepID=W4JS68_HETIT|nr:glutathione S-transferase [Heterobasidion irregulare TC 32-1]ETW76289.1 glutathione S-transferase [Heterobasidion irregulare TC 32-1]